jgi:phage-related minor tail protein
MKVHSAAVNDNTRRMGSSFSGLASQFQDIGVTAAMGMNPMIIALQQGTQIAGQMEFALQGGGTATSVLKEAFLSLLSPLSIATTGLTALAAVGLQMVDWPAAAAWALNLMADSLEVIAPYATMAAAGLALLYAPAIIGGIVSVIAILARMTVAALTAAASLALANPAAAFVLAVTAMVAAANIFRDELAQIFGRDIVEDAKNAANLIIGVFVGAFEAIRATWSMLPAAMGDLGYQAANKFLEGITWMAREAVSIINGLIASINGGLRGAGVDIQIPDLGAPAKTIPSLGVTNPYAGSAAGAAGAATDAFRAAQGRDYVGEIGAAVTSGASEAAGMLRDLAGSLTTVEDAAGGAGRAAKEAADRGVKKLADETLNAAQAAADFAKGVTKGFITDLRQGLQNGEGFFRSFANAALNALDKVVDKLLDDVLDAIFQVNKAGSGGAGGGGGFLGGIFGSIGKFFGFAGGGYTGPGEKYQPAGIVHKGEYVFSAAAVRALGVSNLDRAHRRAKGYAEGGYVDGSTPRINSPANGSRSSSDVVRIVLQDDSGRMAQIADQRIQTSAGMIVQISVERSTRAVKQGLPGMIANAQTRTM